MKINEKVLKQWRAEYLKLFEEKEELQEKLFDSRKAVVEVAAQIQRYNDAMDKLAKKFIPKLFGEEIAKKYDVKTTVFLKKEK